MAGLQIYRELLSPATFLRVHLNSISYPTFLNKIRILAWNLLVL